MLYLCGSPSEGAGVFEDSLEIMHSADLQWTMPLIIFSLCLNMTLFLYIYNKDAPPPPLFLPSSIPETLWLCCSVRRSEGYRTPDVLPLCSRRWRRCSSCCRGERAPSSAEWASPAAQRRHRKVDFQVRSAHFNSLCSERNAQRCNGPKKYPTQRNTQIIFFLPKIFPDLFDYYSTIVVFNSLVSFLSAQTSFFCICMWNPAGWNLRRLLARGLLVWTAC